MSTETLPAGMLTYGQRLGARNVEGLANWSEEALDAPAAGMLNVVLQCPHPRDGLNRRLPVLMRDPAGNWVTVAQAFYDGQCRLSHYELADCEVSNYDPRVTALIERYAHKLATLDCLPTQREYPQQSPWHAWFLLRPGDVEVI